MNCRKYSTLSNIQWSVELGQRSVCKLMVKHRCIKHIFVKLTCEQAKVKNCDIFAEGERPYDDSVKML